MTNNTTELTGDGPVGAPVLRTITIGDVKACLSDGWGDFLAHPGFGLFSVASTCLAVWRSWGLSTASASHG